MEGGRGLGALPPGGRVVEVADVEGRLGLGPRGARRGGQAWPRTARTPMTGVAVVVDTHTHVRPAVTAQLASAACV